MTSFEKIPIQNIYYLLCYAWNRLDERDVVDVSAIDTTDLLDLFAKVLTGGLHHLLKRGLDRGYVTCAEDSRCLRGKFRIAPSLKRNLLVKAQVHCEYDELSYHILHNQILNTTIHSLIHAESIDEGLRDGLMGLSRKLHGIEVIRLDSSAFSRVQLNRNNAFYDFLIKICELIYHNLLVSQDGDGAKFRDFLRDERQMAHLFEEFVRNFYRIETPEYKVGREDIFWDAEPLDEHSASFLPKMITDISIEREHSKVVIDAKYYKETLTTHYDKEKIHSGHLFQLFGYLKNLESKGEINKSCTGVLLYPTVEKDVSLNYVLHGHKIMVRTVNLNKDWKSIHNYLIELLEAA